jgi:NACHT domain
MWIHGLRSHVSFLSFPVLIFSYMVSWIRKKYSLVTVITKFILLCALTFTSSSIIQNIQDMCQTGLATLAFFYFDFRDISKQDARSFLSSLLIQLCRESDNYSEILSSRYSKHGNGTRQPSQEVLVECLKDMLNVPRQGELYIVVDALDECPDFPGPRTPREQVLTILRDLVALHLPHVHFCFTSRPEVDIRNVMEALAVRNVSLHEEVGQKQDISNYIESIFSSNRKIQCWREEDKQYAKDKLLSGARGM